MTIGISAEVILRMFSFPSIVGLIELTEYGLFISTFFVAPHLLRTNEHIRVDIVMSRVDPAMRAARRICRARRDHRRIALSPAWSARSMLIDSIREGTLIFKDLIFPQWWLDWIIPLTSLAMGLQALEMLVAHANSSTPVSHDPSEHVPGIRPEEMP